MIFVRSPEGSRYGSSYAEPAVEIDPRPMRHDFPTPEQWRRRRHEFWRHAAHVGILDTDLGEVRPHSNAELAMLFGVSERTIRRGLAEARALRRRLAEVMADDR